jgi:DNA-binding MarR family transcriptional regulator
VLSAHQASVIDHLDGAEPLHLRDLARHIGVTPSTMSLMIDRLEEGGYVRRRRNSSDQRKVDLLLTPSGVRIKERQKVLDPELVEELLRLLSFPHRKVALEGLRLLAGAAHEMVASGQARKLRRGYRP